MKWQTENEGALADMPRHAGLRKRKYWLEGSEMRRCAPTSFVELASCKSTCAVAWSISGAW
jgi:hypothetical protein